MKPYAYNPRLVPTVFVDYSTGKGVNVTSGARFVVPIKDRRRKTPALADVLNAALTAEVERVYFTGTKPADKWLLQPSEGWLPNGHYLDADVPVGRFLAAHNHDIRVELRRAAEWFGEGDYTPDTARDAWQLLSRLYSRSFGERARLLASPAGTGLDAWARTLPFDLPDVAQLDDELAALVRSTSPQHRVELFTKTAHRAECDACRPLVDVDQVPGFHYLDGRMMYASLTRELGTVDGMKLLNEAQALALLNTKEGKYVRARYQVRYAVPPGWSHAGLLMEKCDNPGLSLDDPDRRWHAPNVPGYIGTTWADSSEIALAVRNGWLVRPLRGLVFGKGRPLDKWTERLVTMRERANDPLIDVSAEVRDLVRGAVRAMLLFAIGGFHSAARDVTHVTDTPLRIPQGVIVTEPAPGLFVWRERVATSGRQRAFHHPEWSSQVWARAHTRLLDSPTGDKDTTAGLLHLAPAHVIGVYGDALYLTEDPRWPDDGRVGRFRHKGAITTAVPAPTTADARNRLRAQAERAST